MVIHIALFRWKNDASKKEIDAAVDDVKKLKISISQIIEISAGKNFSKWSKDYTHAVVVKVKNNVDLDLYRKHPSHVLVARKIEKIELDSIGIDFEV